MFFDVNYVNAMAKNSSFIFLGMAVAFGKKINVPFVQWAFSGGFLMVARIFFQLVANVSAMISCVDYHLTLYVNTKLKIPQEFSEEARTSN